ncbi:MAG TPA: metallophosphoesterase [Polyangia bacterium]
MLTQLLKPKLPGRGRNFSRRRVVGEAVARFVYRQGWAAQLWQRLPGRTEVDVIRHELALLPKGAGTSRPPLRIAFASDFHIGPLTSPRLLDNAFARLAALAPDVLVLGGDYVYMEATHAMARELEARVAAVPARVKLAVLGNHDLWTHHDRIEDALRRAGATLLINDAVRLPAPHDDVAMVGLDDVWAGQPDPSGALAGADGAALKLAVAHSPEAVPFLASQGLRLLLCGHTHGGQIALPTGPVVVQGKHGRRWPAGLYQLDDLTLFVSRGLGSVELPIRAYARPDVSLFTLTDQRGSGTA